MLFRNGKAKISFDGLEKLKNQLNRYKVQITITLKWFLQCPLNSNEKS